jgi:DNA (cytosine-5)-methyltransferase 1
MKPTVIDLFCGIGGFSKGFEMAGFEILFGIDNWDVAIQTFQNNHLNSEGVKADLRELENSFYEKYSGKIDVIIAGPPCQGFSMCGTRDINDDRNNLFEEVVRAVEIIKPKVVIIENVVGLLSMKNPEGKLVKELIKDKLGSLGYSVENKILNASDYGVPQARKRVFFIGSKIGKVGFPQKKGEKITVGDALSNIPDFNLTEYDMPKNEYQKLMQDGEKRIFNHEPMKHNSKVLERIKHVPQGGNWSDIPPDVYDVGGNHSNNYRRLDPKKPSVTLKHAIKSMIIHPLYDRVITAREVARLQSFPDSFVISGNKGEQHQQLANAVPPLLGFEIGKCVLNRLEGKKLKMEVQEDLFKYVGEKN